MTTALNGRVESCPCRPRAPERTVVLLSAACNSEVELADIPLRLFEEAICAGLVNSKDVLVRRLKRAVEPPLSKKYADDVANIVYCIKNCQNLPRVLLKNGKRSAPAYNSAPEQRPSVSATAPSPHVLSSAAAEQAAGT